MAFPAMNSPAMNDTIKFWLLQRTGGPDMAQSKINHSVVPSDSSYFSSGAGGSGSSGRGSSNHSSPATSGSRGGKSSASPTDDFHSDGGVSSDVEVKNKEKMTKLEVQRREKLEKIHKNRGQHEEATAAPPPTQKLAPNAAAFTVTNLLSNNSHNGENCGTGMHLGSSLLVPPAYAINAFPFCPTNFPCHPFTNLPTHNVAPPPFFAPPQFLPVPPADHATNVASHDPSFQSFLNTIVGQSAFTPIFAQHFDPRLTLMQQNGHHNGQASPVADDAARQIYDLTISGLSQTATVQSARSSYTSTPPHNSKATPSPKRMATERNVNDFRRHNVEQPLKISIGSTSQRDDSSRSTFDPSPSLSTCAGNAQRDVGGSSYDGSLSPLSSSLSTSPSSNHQQPPLNVDAKCVVCDDKASGYHYGVVSCEGCKGFFRRTVQRDIKYNCHKESKCSITKITRNRCQFCRFKKCLDSGMAKESVRQDRNRKRKQKDDDEENQAIQNLQHIIKTVVGAHKQSESHVDLEEGYKIAEVCLLQNFGDALISKFVTFAEQIPSYESLTPNAKEILWRSAAVEITALRCAFLETSKKVAEKDDSESKEFFVAKLAPFRTSVKKLARAFKQLEVCQEELALLSAICLMSNRLGLDVIDLIKIEQFQDSLLKALYIQVRLRRCDTPLILFAKLLMKLSDIQTLSLAG